MFRPFGVGSSRASTLKKCGGPRFGAIVCVGQRADTRRRCSSQVAKAIPKSEHRLRVEHELRAGLLFRAWSRTRPPQRLYHYTSAATLAKIVETRSFWVTSLRHMNDARELSHGGAMLDRLIEMRAADFDRVGMDRRILDPDDHGINAYEEFYGVHALCLSELPDDLNQWRAYGDGGRGYAIGLRSDELPSRLTARKGRDTRLQFGRVIYDEDEQSSLLSEVIGRAIELQDEADGDIERNGLRMALRQVVSETLPFLKHPSFRAEAEWRLLALSVGEDDARISFRERNGRLFPYLIFSCRCIEGHAADCLPISEIVHGPQVPIDLESPALRLMTTRFPGEHIEIRGSGVPIPPGT